jgi:hypothetical protein
MPAATKKADAKKAASKSARAGRSAEKSNRSSAEPSVTRLKKTSTAFVVEIWPLHEIKPYEQNARKISEAAIEKVAKSLKEFGWRQPMVVDKDGVLIVGHARRLAAVHLGWVEGPVHVAKDLTDAQIRAYRLMDNRSHEETAWDMDLLVPEIADLKGLDFDLSLTGFNTEEIERFLNETPDVEFKEYDESVADEVKYSTCPECGHVFPK